MVSKLFKFANENVEIISLLGTGAFASVYAVELITSHDKKLLAKNRRKYCLEYESENDVFLCDSTIASFIDEDDDDDANGEFAVKIIKPSMKCPQEIEIALDDLQNEVRLLAELSFHPNIITLHGVSNNFWTAPKTGFIVLERLVESLEKTIAKWRQSAKSSGRFNNLLLVKKRQHSTLESQAKRLKQVAIPIARAMAFLHKQHIIFRDLKPANMGFDSSGVIRLFDFGLARKIKQEELDYRLTGQCGTLRYMAPEVAASQPYGLSADVHSFAMVVWELCTLQKPFGKCNMTSTLTRAVVLKNVHPPKHMIACKGVQKLLSQAWHREPNYRPSFDDVISQLERHVQLQLAVSSSKVEPTKTP